jgi:hypothetical protein
MIDLPTLAEALTSPIWLMAILIFGVIFYFQWSIGLMTNAPRNVKCKRCEEVQHHYFPNTKFCEACYHLVREEMDILTTELEQGREQVNQAPDDAAKVAGYDLAIQAGEALRVMYHKYHKSGLPIIHNMDEILQHAYQEKSALTGEPLPDFKASALDDVQ